MLTFTELEDLMNRLSASYAADGYAEQEIKRILDPLRSYYMGVIEEDEEADANPIIDGPTAVVRMQGVLRNTKTLEFEPCDGEFVGYEAPELVVTTAPATLGRTYVREPFELAFDDYVWCPACGVENYNCQCRTCGACTNTVRCDHDGV